MNGLLSMLVTYKGEGHAESRLYLQQQCVQVEVKL